MGVLDKILGFSREKRGKIITWSLVAAGGVVMFIGIIIAVLGTGIVRPDNIILYANNMKPDEETPNYAYHLEINSPETHITVNPYPSNSTVPVTFQTNSPLISVTPRISSGGTAVVTLNKVNGLYAFSKPDDDEISINVNCGSRTAVIYVKIVLKPEYVACTAVLERAEINHEKPDELVWETATELDMRDFYPELTFYSPKAYYRINAQFKIFGETIYSTINQENGFNTEDISRFVITDLRQNGTEIRLFGTEDSENNYITFYDLATDNPPYIPAGSYFFTIHVPFDGEKYFTITDFEIKLVR